MPLAARNMRGLESALVFAVAVDSSDADEMMIESPVDADGRYRLEGLDAGTVRGGDDGQPISGAVVHAYRLDGGYTSNMTETAADGTYEIGGLRSGMYVVEVWAEGYLVMAFAPGAFAAYYGGGYAPEQAETVHVEEGETVGGIDFDLFDAHLYRILEHADDASSSGPGESVSRRMTLAR